MPHGLPSVLHARGVPQDLRVARGCRGTAALPPGLAPVQQLAQLALEALVGGLVVAPADKSVRQVLLIDIGAGEVVGVAVRKCRREARLPSGTDARMQRVGQLWIWMLPLLMACSVPEL